MSKGMEQLIKIKRFIEKYIGGEVRNERLTRNEIGDMRFTADVLFDCIGARQTKKELMDGVQRAVEDAMPDMGMTETWVNFEEPQFNALTEKVQTIVEVEAIMRRRNYELTPTKTYHPFLFKRMNLPNLMLKARGEEPMKLLEMIKLTHEGDKIYLDMQMDTLDGVQAKAEPLTPKMLAQYSEHKVVGVTIDGDALVIAINRASQPTGMLAGCGCT